MVKKINVFIHKELQEEIRNGSRKHNIIPLSTAISLPSYILKGYMHKKFVDGESHYHFLREPIPLIKAMEKSTRIQIMIEEWYGDNLTAEIKFMKAKECLFRILVAITPDGVIDRLADTVNL